MKSSVAHSVCIFMCVAIPIWSSCSHANITPNNASSPVGQFEIPNSSMQQKIVLALRDEMIRLDGEGLLVRENRPESFIETTDRIAKKAGSNQSAFDFYRTFTQLNSTYPNLHAGVSFPKELFEQITVPGPGIEEFPDTWIDVELPSLSKSRVVISHMKNEKLNAELVGAPVVAINHRPIQEWLDENFIFCKRSLRTQCDRVFESNLLKGVLQWKGGTLVYTVLKNGKKRDLSVKLEPDKSTPSATQDPYSKWRCDWKWQKRYPGFKLVHLGYFACLFEKSDDHNTSLLRISNFQYNRNRERIDPNNPIQSLEQEVTALKKVWQPQSANTKHLIVDVIDNHGGNEPIPYYKILLKKPFLEQFVAFKKTPEFEDATLRIGAFWNENAHKLWFDKISLNGSWAKLKYGEFSQPTAEFCADPTKPCDEAVFYPDEHGFRGKVSIMLNDNCVSSCDGFVWELHHYLNANLYGFYQAADGAYSRWRIDAIRDSSRPDGFKLKVNPQRGEIDPNLIVSEEVAVSLTTDEQGEILSGKPLPLKQFVPIKLGDYHQEVLRVVLKDQGEK